MGFVGEILYVPPGILTESEHLFVKYKTIHIFPIYEKRNAGTDTDMPAGPVVMDLTNAPEPAPCRYQCGADFAGSSISYVWLYFGTCLKNNYPGAYEWFSKLTRGILGEGERTCMGYLLPGECGEFLAELEKIDKKEFYEKFKKEKFGTEENLRELFEGGFNYRPFASKFAIRDYAGIFGKTKALLKSAVDNKQGILLHLAWRDPSRRSSSPGAPRMHFKPSLSL